MGKILFVILLLINALMGQELSRESCENMIFSAFAPIEEYVVESIIYDSNSKDELKSKLADTENIISRFKGKGASFINNLDESKKEANFSSFLSLSSCKVGTYSKKSKHLSISCNLPFQSSFNGLECTVRTELVPDLYIKYFTNFAAFQRKLYFIDESGYKIDDNEASRIYRAKLQKAFELIELHEYNEKKRQEAILEEEQLLKRRASESLEAEKAKKMLELKEKAALKLKQQKLESCFDSCKPKKGAAYDICINDCKRIYGGAK